jgi:hypothetical protein
LKWMGREASSKAGRRVEVTRQKAIGWGQWMVNGEMEEPQ